MILRTEGTVGIIKLQRTTFCFVLKIPGIFAKWRCMILLEYHGTLSINYFNCRSFVIEAVNNDFLSRLYYRPDLDNFSILKARAISSFPKL